VRAARTISPASSVVVMGAAGAGLHLDDLHMRDADGGGIGAEVAEVVGEQAAQVDREAVPQLRCVPAEQHMCLVVVAVRAHRVADGGVLIVVDAGAPLWLPVRAALPHGVRVAAPGSADRAAAHGVHRAVAGGGEGGEHHRVSSNAGGHVQGVGPGDAGGDEVPGVPGVEVRARRADRGAAVLAPSHHAQPAPGVVPARQVHGPGAVPHPGQPGPPGVEGG